MTLFFLSPLFKSLKIDSSIYFDTSNLGIIEVNGQDAAKLLQNQCTINIQKMVNNRLKLSAICNLQGRVISLFYVLKKDDTFHLIMENELIKPTLQWLKKYAAFHKLTLTDKTNHFKLYGVFHHTSPESYYSLTTDIGLTPTPHTNLLSTDEWYKLLMSNYYPRLHTEAIGKYLPFELGLLPLGALDFDKGCYMGQEIIARMHYRSKRQFNIVLANIKCKDNPLYSDIIEENGQLKGTVIDAIRYDDNYISLISIKDQITTPLFLLKDGRYDIQLLSNRDD